MNESVYRKIENSVRGSKKVLVTAHQNPDSDAIGSIVAITRYLEHYNKEYLVYIEEDLGYNDTKYLNSNYIIKRGIDWGDIDLLITLDSSDLNRVGLSEINDKRPDGLFVVNIDHHASNRNFGDINLVEKSASSTTEVITKFFKSVNFKISKEIASVLLSGILADTDNFSNDGTSKDAFAISAYLLEKGANIGKMNHKKQDKRTDVLKVWGKSFDRLKENNNLKLAYTILRKDDIDKAGVGGFSEKLEDLVNFFNHMNGLRLVMVLKEDSDNIRVSLRTTNNNVDVSRLALFFNGGGHKKAAGFSINGKLKKIETGWKIV